ncbi:MAG: trypsin-like peptidase domain-containing protein [Candidatus Kaiserbacteria bacterium]|nr:trypsin-like peptidase domain-containing protein [Candidatus Kaiserbacteria bacterium]
MEIEHLSKSQIVLLTLLVSFVTSIATGIVTVSLMQQAPPVVAQTVNRVIEHTIETVATSTPSKSQSAATIVTQEKTVVVNESDLIAQAVAKADPSIVRIYTNAETPAFLGVGIVLDAGGTIVTDADPIDGRSDALVALPDGTRVRAFVKSRDGDNGFAFLQGATSTPSKSIQWKPLSISTAQPVIGESIVALAGKTTTRIAPGVVTALIPVGGGRIVDTNVSSDSILAGSALISADGVLVGVSTGVSRASSPEGFIPAGVLIPPPAKK